MEKMNLEYLKNEMWIDVCEGEVLEMSDSYKELVSDIGDGEVGVIEFISNFYKILDRLIENNLIEFDITFSAATRTSNSSTNFSIGIAS